MQKNTAESGTNTNFYYIAGNHDYHLLWLKENGADYLIDIKKSVEIKSKDEVFYFIHGYQLEVLRNDKNIISIISVFDIAFDSYLGLGEGIREPFPK